MTRLISPAGVLLTAAASTALLLLGHHITKGNR